MLLKMFLASNIRFEGVFDPLNMRKYKAELNEEMMSESGDELV